MKKAILMTIAVAAGVAFSAEGQSKYGIVRYSADFMRAAPDYESALETQALMGTACEILGTNGYWLKIRALEPEYTAWATDMGIVPADDLEAYLYEPKYICTVPWAEVYDSPKKGADRVTDLVMGDLVRVLHDAREKPVRKGRMSGILLPDGRAAYVTSSSLCDFASWAKSRKATPENLTAFARQFTGTPYMWGGTSPKGFDCSGLVRTVFLMHGILLPRNASEQILEGVEVPLDGFVPGESEGELRPGDLMFFGRKATPEKGEAVTHVAMYIGGGCIIHSSHEVRINSLSPSSDNYYTGTPRLLRARRICDEDGQPYTSVKIVQSPYYFPQN